MWHPQRFQLSYVTVQVLQNILLVRCNMRRKTSHMRVRAALLHAVYRGRKVWWYKGDKGREEEQRKDLKIIITVTKLEATEHFHLGRKDAFCFPQKKPLIIKMTDSTRTISNYFMWFFCLTAVSNMSSVPSWLINTATLVRSCRASISPTLKL